MPEQQGFFARLAQDPAVKGLGKSIGGYATARAEDIAKRKMPGAEDATGVVDAGKKEAKKAAIVPAAKGFLRGAWAKLTGKAKGAKGKRPVNILETAMVGAPIEMVWDAWRDYDQWPNFMKGVEKVDAPKEAPKNDDGEPEQANWTAKIFINRRQWKSTVTEEVEYERIRWKSEGNKGTVDGAVSFTPLGENATLVTLVMEYRSKGFFETIGKTWRVQGRRARLDFKHFQRHISMADQSEALNRPEGDDEQRDDTTGPGDNGDAGLSAEPDEAPEAEEGQRSSDEDVPVERGERRTRRQPAGA